MTREELLAPIVESISRELPLRPAEVARWLADWEIHPVVVAGETVGVFVQKGCEVHYANKRRTTSCRAAVREVLGRLLEEYGYLTTRVPMKDTNSHSFVRRVGFKPTWQDGVFIFYMLDKPPFERT